MGDVDPVDHQVGEQAAAEIPEPAPVAEAVLIERLVGGVPDEVLPGDLSGIDTERPAPKSGRPTSVPAQVDLEHLTDPSRLDQLARLLNVGHAPLLHADLNDLPVPILSVDDGRTLGEIMSQRFLDIDILAGFTGIDRHRHVPVVRAGDQDGVDVLAVEDLAIVFGGECLGIRQLFRFVQVGVVHVADSRDPDSGNLGQGLHEVHAPPARTQAGDVERVVGRIAPRRLECRERARRNGPDTPDRFEE